MSRRWRLATCLTGILVALLPQTIAAQDDLASLTVIVRDTVGATLPGVVVRVVDDRTDQASEFVSADEHVSRTLPAGRYRVEAALDGFEPYRRVVVLSAGRTTSVEVGLSPAQLTEGIIVTARRTEEVAQDVPIPLTVLTGGFIESTGNFNVNRLQQTVPTVQFYTTNPRNSFLNIRGLGLPFGLANDGIEPGVGMYVDGVFHSRPAAATFDFIDVERLEVLRGPQGTLFGKNTTAGALNVTTRAPNFMRREGAFELNYGNFNFLQAKGSLTGPMGRHLAGRMSVSSTQRDGLLRNVRTGEDVNTLDNHGAKGQLRFRSATGVVVTAAADYTRQRPNGYAPVAVGVAPTLRPADRQFPRIAADLGYSLPSTNPFDRLIDTDTPWRSDQDYGGASLTVDWAVGPGQLTAITAWRYWDWGPSNDRDFTGLPVTTLSQAPSLQKQWTQEVRYAGRVSRHLDFVVGAFAFHQTLDSEITLESGPAAARWNLAPTPAAATPGLLDGYGQLATVDFRNTSAALFGQAQWQLTDRLRVLPGLRLNYDRKEGDYRQTVYGGLQTSDPALVAIQRSVYGPAAYLADIDDFNVSGQLTLGYAVTPRANAYATYATSFKSVGLNIAGGLPVDPTTGLPDATRAVVAPEDERHVEVGLKTSPLTGVTANVTAYNTDVRNYQTTVFGGNPGALRGYLANAERVRVRGVEFDTTARVHARLSVYGTVAYADGRNLAFANAPAPLEATGGPSLVDISGTSLAGLSKWAFSFGTEYSRPAGRHGEIFGGADASHRSSFSSNATPSAYLMVDGYSLVNARVGLRRPSGWSLSLWARNLLNRDYFEMLSPVGGNTGMYVGFLGDPRAFGVTVRTSFGGN